MPQTDFPRLKNICPLIFSIFPENWGLGSYLPTFEEIFIHRITQGDQNLGSEN